MESKEDGPKRLKQAKKKMFPETHSVLVSSLLNLYITKEVQLMNQK